MTYENIKSVILTLLVISSALLTWNLWTYQPDYETIENSYVQQVSIGEKKDIKTIIKPERVLFHYPDAHYGTEVTSELEKVIREVSLWNVYDVKNYTNKVEDFKKLVHGNGVVEIIFPEKVPIAIYKNVLSIEDKSVPNFSFDRIVMNMENIPKDTGAIYFVSYDTKEVYISHVSSNELTSFQREFYQLATNYSSYTSFEPKDDFVLFFPENEMYMMRYKYYPDYLDSEKFKEALFTDPSFVQKSFISEGEEFTDGSSKMNIIYDENMLFYINPIGESEFSGNSVDILQRGIDFINEHGGWTDPYRFVAIDEWQQKLTFRLYSTDGYPVFNEKGMAEITEVWGRNEIIKYIRPNFSLDLPLRTEMLEVVLPSGKQILDYIVSQEDFKLEQLEDLRLGYHMEKDAKEPKLIVLDPSWYIRYNGDWKQVRMGSLRGNRDGLE